MILGKEEISKGKRKISLEGMAPEEELLRRWGFVLAGERVASATLETLSVLVANAPRMRSAEHRQ